MDKELLFLLGSSIRLKHIKTGQFIFVKDSFFELIKEPHLMRNKKYTKRPHFFAFSDKDDKNLWWIVPASSRIKKYDRISNHSIRAKDVLLKVRIRRKTSYLLFADMFPVLKQYTFPYFKNRSPVYLRRKDIPKALKYVKNTLSKLNHGMTFGSTFPNLPYILTKEHKWEQKNEK